MSRRRISAIAAGCGALLIVGLLATSQPIRSPLAPTRSPGAPNATTGTEAPSPNTKINLAERGSFQGSVTSLTFERPPRRELREKDEYKRAPSRVGGRPRENAAPALRQADPPLLSFEALDAATFSNATPPDPHGDVGTNHYIGAVNTVVGIFSKANGTRLASFTFDAFMSAAGMSGACGTGNMGDPYILYDRVSGRWLITDMAWINDTGPFFQCIAASKTGDPVAGGYWTYAFQIASNNLADYPKFGAWADGIYMASNLFYQGDAFAGVEVDVFNRTDLINGAATIRVQSRQLSTAYWSLLPVNDEFGTATIGTPAMFISDDPGLRMWKWAIDWGNAANSVWSGPFSISGGQSYDWAPDLVQQRGSSEGLDTLSDRLMSAAQWSNVDGTPAIWISRSIDAGSGRAGLYWAEIRGIGGASPTIYQDMQYVVANSNRWMPSLVVNMRGSMALAYSIADASTYPSLAYAGRTASATLGSLDFGERTIVSGLSPAVTSYSRWGDYFSASLDPSDDCTMWLMGEYMSGSGGWNWTTRIAKVSIGSCADAPVNASVPTTNTDPKVGAAVTASNGSWSGDPTFTYAWYACTASGAAAQSIPVDCASIRNATASSFTPTATQVGKRLRVLVTATNSAAARTYASAATNPVASTPALATAPAISGTAQFASTLSATSGSWSATPTATYAYKWIRCNATGSAARTLPSGCEEISVDSTAPTYSPVASDVGKFLRVRVTASNSAGDTVSFSKTTSVIKGITPASTAPPLVSGTARVGQSFSATSGSWSGTPTPSSPYVYAWFSCTRSGVATASPSNCSAIRNATSSSFTLTSAQLGKFVRVRVTATTSAGSAQFYSAATSAIAP